LIGVLGTGRRAKGALALGFESTSSQLIAQNAWKSRFRDAILMRFGGKTAVASAMLTVNKHELFKANHAPEKINAANQRVYPDRTANYTRLCFSSGGDHSSADFKASPSLQNKLHE
jgi:hypothetical protein